MIELKIICQCGQKYKFDVEPVNGRMPFTVKCPICGLDGTASANTMLAARMAAPPAPVMASASAPAPVAPPPPPPGLRMNPAVAPVAAVAAAAPPPPPPIAPPVAGLRINRDAHAAAPAPAGPPVARDNNAPPALGANRPFAVNAAANPPKQTSFGMGVLGAFIGALVGSAIYFAILHAAGIYGFFGLRLLAIGVGGLAGWLASFMSKGEGSKELGGIVAVLVVGCLIAAQYFVAMSWFHSLRDEVLKDVGSMYADAVKEAKKVVAAVPTGSDAEIRRYMAKTQVEDGDTNATPASISDDDVKEFRDNILKEDQDLASGNLTKEQYEQKNGLKTSETKDEEDSQDNTVKGLFLLFLLRPSNLISLGFAGVLAFRLSANN